MFCQAIFHVLFSFLSSNPGLFGTMISIVLRTEEETDHWRLKGPAEQREAQGSAFLSLALYGVDGTTGKNYRIIPHAVLPLLFPFPPYPCTL